MKRFDDVFIESKFNPELADSAEVIWCEWLNNTAIEVANYPCKAKKILRVHAYDAFGEAVKYIDFSKFYKVIFVAKHIKDYVESKFGKIENAVVISNGVKINEPEQKYRNNKVAWAGDISRKKGVGELFLIANHFDEFEFHVAGRFNEEDVAWWFNQRKPDNVILHPYQYDIEGWFMDKTFIMNTSIREGCPVGVLQGMERGLKPVIRNWIGADKIYEKEWVWDNFTMLEQILYGEVKPSVYHDYVKKNFNFEKKFKEIEKIVNE
jgi:hypothetical protein